MTRINLIAPDGDELAERELAIWAESCRSLLAQHHPEREVTFLRGAQVNRATVSQTIASGDLTMFFGHGIAGALGYPDALIDAANVSLAAGQVLVGMACEAGRGFGQQAIEAGVRAFLGFDDLFFVSSHDPETRSRAVASLVRFASGQSSLATVNTELRETFEAVERFYRVGPGRGRPGAEPVWLAAHINANGLVIFGDQEATVS